MAYKDIEKRRANWRKWYLRHKEEFDKRCREYNKTQDGKDSAIRRAKRQRDKNPEKWKARQKVRNAIYRGFIKRGRCEICGELKTHAHHKDYTKPLEVNWLCSKCHFLKHHPLPSPPSLPALPR